ncbi:Protein-S-isoprenylcysteine O-methyltransferase [Bertholletia excelsa]
MPTRHPAMETSSVLSYSKLATVGLTLANNCRVSLRPFNKHLEDQLSLKNPRKQKSLTVIQTQSKCSFPGAPNHGSLFSSIPLSSSGRGRDAGNRQLIICSYSNATSSEPDNSLLNKLKILSIDSLKGAFSRLTPLDVCKWSLVFSIAIAAAKWSINTLFNPFFWMYFSWTWFFWPWFVALGLAIYGLYCLRKHLHGEANVFEQLAIVTSAFTWLTLVPPAHFNGYLEGWPFVFFLVYHYFFFFNVSVRKRLYGDYHPRQHDPKWDISPPNWHRLLFCAGVMVSHWLAAFEGPELHLVPGGWFNNLWVWALIMLTLFAQYHSTLYLANYSEKVVVPTAVVQFGPYRWVRHPIYASTVLLFVTYFAALRAPISSLLIVVVCLAYYEQKAKLEEALMIETFGERYMEYMNKVRYKFIPFVY